MGADDVECRETRAVGRIVRNRIAESLEILIDIVLLEPKCGLFGIASNPPPETREGQTGVFILNLCDTCSDQPTSE